MKKLLVTAIGAAAALGASAAGISTQRFENVTGELPQAATISSLNTLAGGNFWSGDELTNTYTYISCAGEAFPQDKPLGPATKALEVKTTFGSPLTVKAIAGDNTSTNIPASGIYFDSLVKFTVCEEAPEQTYEDAKIIMWLQEEYASDGDTVLGTNIMVRASYINADGTFTPTNFVCKRFTGSIDSWYRVTIKTWASILNNNSVPGFAIFIDGVSVNVADEYTMADEIAANLTEAAGYFGKDEVFPSLVQGNAAGKSTITSASFDGTGKLTDLVFTDVAPFDAAKDYVAPKAEVTIGELSRNYDTLAEAMAAVNGATAGQTATMKLKKGMTIDGTLAFASEADVILDFAGVVLTNESASAAAISNEGRLTITNSTEAVGGVYCAAAGAAVVNGATSEYTDIKAGCFWGAVVEQSLGTLQLFGGSYSANTMTGSLAPGKMFSYNDETGLYDVVDAKYTVIFVSGINGQITNKYDNLGAGAEMPTPPDASIAGKNYVWQPEVASTVTGDATYTAVYTDINYTIKFVYGLNKEETNTVVTTYYQTVSEPVGTARTGYTLEWSPEIQDWPITVTHGETYEATYKPIEYTITFVPGDGATVDPATTNYTIESGAITLPTPTRTNVGPMFDGWTNATMTITTENLTFTPTAANLGNFTLYAKWTAGGPTYPEYIDTSDATVKNQYDAWKAANNVASGDNDYEAAFLLNVAPDMVGAMLTSTDVSISGTTITIDINRGNLNGYVYIQRSATLAGLAGATPEAVTVVPADGNNKAGGIDNGGSITLTDSGDSMFYRIGVQIAPVAVPNP